MFVNKAKVIIYKKDTLNEYNKNRLKIVSVYLCVENLHFNKLQAFYEIDCEGNQD